MTDNLKPCPFCNSTEHLKIISCSDEKCNGDCTDCDYMTFTVCCSVTSGGCGASSGYKETKEKAIKHWNRRADNDR